MEMTIYPRNEDAVSVSSFEWGVIGIRLPSVMSRGEPTRWPESSGAANSNPSPQKTLEVIPSELESEVVPSCDANESKKEGKNELSSSASIEDNPSSFDEGHERRKLKCEDSSYDSDFDPCDAPSSPRLENDHKDVSRTASETLAAEFDEYVTLCPRETSALTSTRTSVTVFSSSTAVTRTSSAQGALLSSTPALTLTEATPQPCLLPPAFLSAASPLTQASSKFVPPSLTTSESPASSSSFPNNPGIETTASGVSSKPLVTSKSTGLETCTDNRSECTVHSLASVIAAPEYPQQVEFGVKLGYSEPLVQLALSKLGLNPNKNELLDELIRLGAGTFKTDSEGEVTEVEDAKEDKEISCLRTIVIDGSSVAMSHGNKTTFSCKGIRLCVDWFRGRGHSDIRVFVPKFRKETSKVDATITEQEILTELEDEGVLSFTPSRTCSGKRIVAYDDRYILKEALSSGGVVVSNDNFRDLVTENAGFKKVVEEAILMYSWVNGRFEPPDDPLGRNGPPLDVFLRKLPAGGASLSAKDSRPCPYGRKCTYGNKCKYMHPERGTAPIKSVTERLQEQAQKHYQKSRDSSPGDNLRAKSLTLPVTSSAEGTGSTKKPLTRTQSNFPSLCPQLHQQTTSKDEQITLEKMLPIGSVSVPTSAGLISPSSLQAAHIPASSQGQRSFDCLSTSSSGMADDLRVYRSLDSSRSSTLKTCELPFQLMSQGAFSTGWQPWRANSSSLEGSQITTGPKTQRFSSLPIDNQLTTELENMASDNPHRKLQRQLSINPVGDPRIPNMHKQLVEEQSSEYSSYLSSLALPQTRPLQQLFPQQQAQHCIIDNESLNSRSCISGPRCLSPNPCYGFGNRDLLQPYHPPLTRHSSSQETKQQLSSFSQPLYSPYYHGNVTRNLSAPDPIWGGGGGSSNLHQPLATAHHHKRLNSTSDSRLNLHGACSDSLQLLSDPFEESINRFPPFSHRSMAGISSTVPAPGPIGSRPMSPQQSLSSSLHLSPLPSRRAVQHPSPTPSTIITPSGTHEDERFKIFYHLSQLFPEAQVRSVLLKHPEETDPTKICASILSNPAQALVGSRPMSPQQQHNGQVHTGAMCTGLGAHLPLRGSSSLNSIFSPTVSVESSKESARLEAFSILTKLFPEDQVHKVLRAYPEETDPIKFIMLLVALKNQS